MAAKKLVRRNVVKQGRRTFTITSTIDPERQVETRVFEVRSRGRTQRHKFEIDMTTGDLLPLPGMKPPEPGTILAELERALLTFSSKALENAEPVE